MSLPVPILIKTLHSLCRQEADYNQSVGTARLEKDVARLSTALSVLPEPSDEPFMVLVSGLPGSGKSYLARRLAEKTPATILQSDALRKALVGKPRYTPAESGRLFQAMRRLTGELLARRIPVIIDATNITEKERRYFYGAADRLGVKTVTVRTHAPPELVKSRLIERRHDPDENSEADWGVHQRMLHRVERIKRHYIDVDTSDNVDSAIMRIVQEITNPAKIASLLKGENDGNQC